jgi:hypothetical protein
VAAAELPPNFKKTRLSSRQASNERLRLKVEREDLNRRYSSAFKEATETMFNNRSTNNPRAYKSADILIDELNVKYNLVNAKKKLKKSTIYRGIGKGLVGESPFKKGPQVRIPEVLLHAVSLHSKVSQVGDGELNGRSVKRLIGAATLGTEHETKFKVESAWRKIRRNYPESFQVSNRLMVEDARAQWTTHDNLQQWFDDVKMDLISSGLVIDREVYDENGLLLSELDFRSEEVKRRIINMDETHHDLSITGDKGGQRALSYYCAELQRGGKRSVKPGRHVTGVYATNAAGESLPPLYIFDSGAQFDDNFRVKVEWLKGLPKVEGRYGCPTLIESDSFCAVRQRGSMDDKLLNDYISNVIMPLYPNLSKATAFDPITGKLLHGPVILKIDSGPGRIVATLVSLEQRAALFQKGLIILAGLPNATGVQQEMDALYGPFKSATYRRGEQVLTIKLRDRGLALAEQRRLQQQGERLMPHQRTNARPAAAAPPAILALGFSDLARIVDGEVGELDVKSRPFTNCFTQDKVLSAWNKIGFVPFNRNCLKNKHVRNELGQHEKNQALEELQLEYDTVIADAEESGLNPGVFDVRIPVAKHVTRIEGEDEQVEALVATKGAFAANALWNVCGSRIGNCSVVIRAQRRQLEMEMEKTVAQAQLKSNRNAKLLEGAQTALEKHETSGVDTLNEKDWGAIIRWVLPASKAVGRLADLRKRDAIIAKLATLQQHWSTYIPARVTV